MREYADFSWPLFLASALAVAAGQVPLLVASRELGVAAVGAIALATTVAVFAHRVDEVITGSLYPAIARAKDDASALWEAFSMSNRLALMWAVPFGAAAVLFAGHLVEYVLGERWRPAVPLIQLLGAAAAVNQVGFNWTAFFRAQSRTRPIAVANGVLLAAVLAIAVPLLLSDGLAGYGAGWLAATVLFVVVRLGYLARVFPAGRMVGDLARAVLPTAPAVVAVLALRMAGISGTAPAALAEVALYALVALASALLMERRLLVAAFALVRRPAPASAAPVR
jgi:O-antigen/teichoic acid export membrane protein